MAAIPIEALGPDRLELFPGMLDQACSGHSTMLPRVPLDRSLLGRYQHGAFFPPNCGSDASFTLRRDPTFPERGGLAVAESGQPSSAYILRQAAPWCGILMGPARDINVIQMTDAQIHGIDAQYHRTVG